MKETQKKFLGATLAASSVLGIVAPSMTAMATTIDDEANATVDQLRSVINEYSVKLEKNPNFANYHRVKYAAERLAKYDQNESNNVIETISRYDKEVFTPEIVKVVDKMDGFAQSKKMQMFDDLLNEDIPNLAKVDSESADYLKSRIDIWGKAVVFEIDLNYSRATDSIMKVKELRESKKFDEAEDQVKTAKNEIKNIKTYDINGAYLEAKLKIEEDKLNSDIENSTLRVKSAEAINARETKIVFNKELDEDSAENEDNYTIYIGKDDTKRKEFSANLQDDKKTVILQFYNRDNDDKDEDLTDEYYLENGQSYKVEVKNVLDVNGKKAESYTGNFQVFNDDQAPKLLNTEYKGSTIKFTFDEPLNEKDIPTVKIDSTTLSSKEKNYTFAKDAGEYTLSVSLKDAPDKVKDYGKHTVKLSGVTDCAGNSADMFRTEYDADEDNEKPEVEEIKAESENSFRIKFSTDIDDLDIDNLEIKKGSHKFTSDEFEDDPIEKIEDKDYTYEITLKNDTSSDNPLYDDDEDSVDLNVKVKDYKGTNDVMGDDYSKKITLNKDREAPEVKSDDLNRVQTIDGKDYLVVLFNKDLSLEKNDTKYEKINVVKDGIKKDVKDAWVDKDKKNKLIIKLDDNKNLGTGKYKITLEKGVVKDKSGNKNEAQTTTLNYSNDNSDAFTIKTNAVSVNENVEKWSGDKNVIRIQFKEIKSDSDKNIKMSDSALDLGNYKINGVKLDNESYDGTSIAFTSENDKDEVEIRLTKGNIDSDDDDNDLVLSQDIKADDGRYLVNNKKNKDKDNKEEIEDNKDYKVQIKLLDDTAPEIDKAEFVKEKSDDRSTKIIKVTFTEAVTSNGKAKNDFKVKVGGDKVDIASVTEGEDDDTLIIKLDKTININTSGRVTVEITEDKDDNNGDVSITDRSDLGNKAEATDDPIKVKDTVVEGTYTKVPQVTVKYGDNKSKDISGDASNSLLTNSATLRLSKNTDNIDNSKVVLKSVKKNDAGKKEETVVAEGKELRDTLVSSNGYKLDSNGDYVLTVEDTYGNKTVANVTIDAVKPVVVLKDKSGTEIKTTTPDVYEVPAPITLTSIDKDIDSAKLVKDDGKEVAVDLTKGHELTEVGVYKLVVTDKAGNVTTVTVTIK